MTLIDAVAVAWEQAVELMAELNLQIDRHELGQEPERPVPGASEFWTTPPYDGRTFAAFVVDAELERAESGMGLDDDVFGGRLKIEIVPWSQHLGQIEGALDALRLSRSDNELCEAITALEAASDAALNTMADRLDRQWQIKYLARHEVASSPRAGWVAENATVVRRRSLHLWRQVALAQGLQHDLVQTIMRRGENGTGS